MHPRAEQLIRDLELQPHPEGGHYAEVHRSTASTSIYFLLAAGEMSRWHRVRSEEIWHFYEGSPLELLQLTPTGTDLERIVLGPVSDRERPVHCVPRNYWQAARSRGAIYARGLHGRAGVPVRRLRAAQGFTGARRIHQPGSPRGRPVRVAYEYEYTHCPYRRLVVRLFSLGLAAAGRWRLSR